MTALPLLPDADQAWAYLSPGTQAPGAAPSPAASRYWSCCPNRAG